jgi:hypothetical protein
MLQVELANEAGDVLGLQGQFHALGVAGFGGENRGLSGVPSAGGQGSDVLDDRIL